jgi:hypothetical protein
MDEKGRHKLAELLVDKTKLVVNYEGINFIQFKIEYPFLKGDANRDYYLKLELGRDSWNFGMPPGYHLITYLETLFRIKDESIINEIRDLFLDIFEERIKNLREYLLTP